jgi:hypothetical protein
MVQTTMQVRRRMLNSIGILQKRVHPVLVGVVTNKNRIFLNHDL